MLTTLASANALSTLAQSGLVVAAFSPATTAGLWSGYTSDTNTSSHFTVSAGTVTHWLDQSGNSRHYVQDAAATRGVIGTGPNSYYALDLSGGVRGYALYDADTSLTAWDSATGITIAGVWKFTLTDGNDRYMWDLGNDAGRASEVALYQDGTANASAVGQQVLTRDGSGNAQYLLSPASRDTNWHTWVLVWNRTAGSQTLYVDGTAYARTGLTIRDPSTAFRIAVGAFEYTSLPTYNKTWFSGNESRAVIAEVWQYTQAHDATTAAQFDTYFSAKYAI